MTKNQLSHLSFSGMRQHADCPRGWYAQSILGRKSPPGEAAAWGKHFEDTVTAQLRATVCPSERKPKRDEPKPTPEIIPATPTQVIEMTKQNDEAEKRLQDELRRATSVYLATPGALVPVDPSQPTRELLSQKEVWMEPALWESLADYYGVRSSIHLPLLGYIDILERADAGMRRRVVDFKTSTRKGFQATWPLQLLIYALSERAQVCEIHLVVRPTTKLDENGEPIRPKKPGQFRPFVWSFQPTPESFKWMMSWVGAQAAGIRRDAEASCLEDLVATPCFSCAYCPESGTCEAYLLSKLQPLGGGDSDD